jgi:hypothetical protein
MKYDFIAQHHQEYPVVLATCGIRPPIEPFEYIQPDRSSLADYPE